MGEDTDDSQFCLGRLSPEMPDLRKLIVLTIKELYSCAGLPGKGADDDKRSLLRAEQGKSGAKRDINFLKARVGQEGGRKTFTATFFCAQLRRIFLFPEKLLFLAFLYLGASKPDREHLLRVKTNGSQEKRGRKKPKRV